LFEIQQNSKRQITTRITLCDGTELCGAVLTGARKHERLLSSFAHIYWSQELTVACAWGEVLALVRSLAFATILLKGAEDAPVSAESRQLLSLMRCYSFLLQVVGIFAGFGLLLLVASPFLLLATPFVLCCKCKCNKGDDDPLPT